MKHVKSNNYETRLTILHAINCKHEFHISLIRSKPCIESELNMLIFRRLLLRAQIYVSGHCQVTRLQKLRQTAADLLLNVVRVDDHVGIVTFNHTASTISPLRKINCLAVRQQLTSMLPTISDGGTSIGAGLLEGVQVLNN